MSDETFRERAERYLHMAAENTRLAQKAGEPGVSEAYLKMAAVWTRLAEDLSSRHPANDESAEDLAVTDEGVKAQH